MALPKINVMTYTLTLPSTGKELKYRPFLVKEEKVLMMAMQSGDNKDMVRALREIIDSCVMDKIDTKTLPMFDIEYIFLQLRARSVGEKIPIQYSLPDDKCEKSKSDANCTYTTEIDVDDIKVEYDENHKDLIELNDEIKIKMRYPKIEASTEIVGLEGKKLVDKTFDMIGDCIEYIMEGEEMHQTSDYTKKDISEFLNSLSSGQFRNIQEFFDTMPKVKKEVTGKCEVCGKENTRVLEGMGDFFV